MAHVGLFQNGCPQQPECSYHLGPGGLEIIPGSLYTFDLFLSAFTRLDFMKTLWTAWLLSNEISCI